MLTVKKFGVMFDLSVGGYVSALIGLIMALLTIFVFPPDIDLADDDSSSSYTTVINDAANMVTTTFASVIEATTEDDDDNDDDPKLSAEETKDETNDVVLGVNICLIFFGWLLLISSLLLIYGTFKRQSKLLIPYMFALFETALLVILLEVLPEFIDDFHPGWFLLLNFLIALAIYLLIAVYSLYCEFALEELNRLNLY